MKIKYRTNKLTVTTIGAYVTVIPEYKHETKIKVGETFKVHFVDEGAKMSPELGKICRRKSDDAGMWEKYLRLATSEEVELYKKNNHED